MRSIPSAAAALAALLPLLAGAVHAAPLSARQAGAPPPLVPLATSGFTAAYCAGGAAPAISCPAGRAVQVTRAAFGYDAACPSSASAPVACSLTAQSAAALAAWAAALCDGQLQCAPPAPADVAAAFGSPCAGAAVRVDWACRDSAVDPPTPAAPLSSDPLRRAFPATTVGQKCPKYAAGVASAVNGAYALSQKFAAGGPAPTGISIFAADLAATNLDAAVRAASGGALNLDTVTELNITAFNFDLGNGTVVVARNNSGFTKVRVEAFNLISNGGSLDVRSHGPDASGRFGPDVTVRAARVFGPAYFVQNGVPAGTAQQVQDMTWNIQTNYLDGSGGFDYTKGGCSLTSGEGGSPGRGWDIMFQSYAWACNDTAGSLQPLCYTDLTCNETPCTTAQISWATTDYIGPNAAPPQADGLPYQVNLDRFVFPAFVDNFGGTGAKAPGKTVAYGSATSQAGAFYTRDGLTTASAANPTSGGTWGFGPAIGIISTADFTYDLGALPSSNHPSEAFSMTYPSQPPTAGLLGLVGGPNTPAGAAAPFPGATYYQKLVTAMCGSLDDFPPFAVTGVIDYNTAMADPVAYGGPSTVLSRFAAGCADEMVSAGRYADAQAFLSDALPSLPAADPATARGFATLGSLRTARREVPSHAVPLLSAATLEQAVGTELAAMQYLEANLTSLQAQGTTAAGALSALVAANATIGAAVGAAQVQVQGDLKSVQLYSNAFQALNQTYQDRYTDVQTKQAAFQDGVKKAESAAIAEIVVEFILDIAVLLATEGAAGSSIANTAKEAGSLAKAFANLEKFASILSQIGTMLYNVQQLVAELIPLVNQIQSLPSDPGVQIPPDAVAAASGSNDTIASLSSALLSYQDLRDQATVYLGPAIQQGIDGASDYALSLSALANAGIDMVGLETQLVTAQLKLVQSAAKLQAALAAQTEIAGLLAAAQGSAGGIAAAATAVQLDLLDRKARALDLVYQIGEAYGFARTATYQLPQGLPDPSSPAAQFVAAVDTAIQALDNQVSLSQPVCNSSWIVQDPAFIGNLSKTGIAFLDFTDPTQLNLANFFSGLDDVHMLQINLKPYGIRYNGTGISNPVLELDIDPTGAYRNTFTAASGTRYVEDFLAVPWSFAMQVEPNNNWQVTVPGSLTGDPAQRFYVPSIYGRFRVSGNPDMVASWDWSAVWGVQVELWGFATKAGAPQTGASGIEALRGCQSLSPAAIEAVTPKGLSLGVSRPAVPVTTTTRPSGGRGAGAGAAQLAVAAVAAVAALFAI